MESCTRLRRSPEMGPWSDGAPRSGSQPAVVVARRRNGQDHPMITPSRSEPRSIPSGSVWEALFPHRLVRVVLGFCCFEAAYYFAYRYGMSFSQASASPFWFPDSVLLCAMLRVRPRWWWVLLVGTIPIRFLSEVASAAPLGLLTSTLLNDWAKAAIGAALLRRFMADPIRFDTVRNFGIYCLVAVLALPAASAVAGALAR